MRTNDLNTLKRCELSIEGNPYDRNSLRLLLDGSSTPANVGQVQTSIKSNKFKNSKIQLTIITR